jgi:hypothetical protein
VSVAERLTPAAAVIVAELEELTARLVAVKEADLAPAGTVTLGGTWPIQTHRNSRARCP